MGDAGHGPVSRGIDATEVALRINPDLTPAYGSLVAHNLGLGRFAEAAAALQRAAERKLENPLFLVSRYYLAFLEGDEAGMKREVERAHGNLEAEDWMSHNQALVLARSGQMRNARVLWRHTIERTQQTGHRERAAIYRAAEAVCEAHIGNRDLAKESARAALSLAQGRDVVYAAAFALALAGEFSESQRLAEDLARRFPEDTPVQFEYLPTLRALFALDARLPSDAIDRLHAALPYDLAMPGTAFFAKFGGLYPAYVRGQAYLEAGRGREAAAESKSPRPPRHRACRSDRCAGAPAIGESARLARGKRPGHTRLSGLPRCLEARRLGYPPPQTGTRRIREAIKTTTIATRFDALIGRPPTK